MSDEALEGLLREVSLDLDGLVERLHADELLESGGARLELLLREVGDLVAIAWKPFDIVPKFLSATSMPCLPNFWKSSYCANIVRSFPCPSWMGVMKIVGALNSMNLGSIRNESLSEA